MRKDAQPTFLRVVMTLLSLIAVVGMSCNLPFGGGQDRLLSTPTISRPTSLPTPQQDLPPTVLEVQPESGSILNSQDGLIITFD
ncbi:MAG: hypothetical protein N2646_06250, partial [Bellilinea sp.]|nr:hypothetical protein [Bellilinea sp.]